MTYKFSVGDKVRIKNDSYNDVKRVPRYIMGKVGTVEIVRGCFSNPTDHLEERPPIYSIGFDQEQISQQGSKRDKIIVDVFEDWMIAE